MLVSGPTIYVAKLFKQREKISILLKKESLFSKTTFFEQIQNIFEQHQKNKEVFDIYMYKTI